MNQKLIRDELRAARHTSFLVKQVLLKVLRDEFKDSRTLYIQPRTQLRLAVLQVWAKRNHVSVYYVAKVMLTYWRTKTHKEGRKRPHLLGAKLPVFTSAKCEAILQSSIRDDFPDGVNITQHKTKQRLHVLGLDAQHGKTKSLINKDYPEQSCKIYRERIEHRRKRIEEARTSEWRTRRRWRGNPWFD